MCARVTGHHHNQIYCSIPEHQSFQQAMNSNRCALPNRNGSLPLSPSKLVETKQIQPDWLCDAHSLLELCWCVNQTLHQIVSTRFGAFTTTPSAPGRVTSLKKNTNQICSVKPSFCVEKAEYCLHKHSHTNKIQVRVISTRCFAQQGPMVPLDHKASARVFSHNFPRKYGT